jgi:tetratricopeptide (TPR) repeat protein
MAANYHIGPEAFRFFREGYQHQIKGEFARAIEMYKKSIAIQPTAEAYTFLGWSYSHIGDLLRAIDMCHKAIDIDPDFGNPYNDIGAYLLQLGEFDAAIPWLQKARKASRYENPEFPCCNLGKIYELKGLWPLAKEQYEEALLVKPECDQAVQALERLNCLLN